MNLLGLGPSAKCYDTVTDKILNWPLSCSWSGGRIRYILQSTEISLILMVGQHRQLDKGACFKVMEKPRETSRG